MNDDTMISEKVKSEIEHCFGNKKILTNPQFYDRVTQLELGDILKCIYPKAGVVTKMR